MSTYLKISDKHLSQYLAYIVTVLTVTIEYLKRLIELFIHFMLLMYPIVIIHRSVAIPVIVLFFLNFSSYLPKWAHNNCVSKEAFNRRFISLKRSFSHCIPKPSKHDTLTQCWADVGPASQTACLSGIFLKRSSMSVYQKDALIISYPNVALNHPDILCISTCATWKSIINMVIPIIASQKEH